MDEDLKITCTECRDLEFARNLARSMKEGYGRHVSSQFRPNPTRPPSPGNSTYSHNLTYAEMDSIIRQRMTDPDHPFYSFLRRRNRELTASESRVIGHAGDHKIRTSMRDCEIGDMIPTRDTNPASKFYEFLPPDRTTVCFVWHGTPVLTIQERWTFEHVHTRMTADRGATWNEEYFWKRIS